MKRVLLPVLVILLGLTACGRKLDRQTRDQVRTFGGASLKSDAVEILDVQEQGAFAVVEIEVRTAVKMVRKGDDWELQEIRTGDRQWVSATDLLEILHGNRAERTRYRLERISKGIEAYRQEQSRVPQAGSFLELIDLLSPKYLPEIIRLDAWSQPFYYIYQSPSEYVLGSPGPDGEIGTGDDVVAGRVP